MNKINILDASLADKIAAGEVVERPSSVIKELVENSIDASSTKIDIFVIDGGRTLIEVKDNGVGMSKEDAMLSIKRHATSKIRFDQDLFNIKTMGFRGEALSAISSVSKFTLFEEHSPLLLCQAVLPLLFLLYLNSHYQPNKLVKMLELNYFV